jgi:opacity protein-like surface antigen
MTTKEEFMKMLSQVITMLAVSLFMSVSIADDFGGQVFYHYGQAKLAQDRGGQVFTDTAGNTGRNDDTSGWNVGAGLDLPMIKGIGPGDLLGEVMVDYAHFSKKEVVQATSALLGSPAVKKVTVSSLNVTIAPKYQMTGLVGGDLRPWLVPVGLSFLVNSPPSDNTTYLDVGVHMAAGLEYAVIKNLSLGLAYRNTMASKDNDVDNSYSSIDLYAGVNF